MHRLILATLLLTSAAHAEPPPGTDLNSPAHKWWECHKQPSNSVSCCSEADGHILNDSDWRTTQDPEHPYEIRVEGKWGHLVPKRAVLVDNDGCGPDPTNASQSSAKVWYIRFNDLDGSVHLSILCFMVGTLY